MKDRLDMGNLPGNIIVAMNALQDMPIYVDDTAGITVEAIEREVHSQVRWKEVKVVFIDYLQLLNTEEKYAARDEEISVIGSKINYLAKECSANIVVASTCSHYISRHPHSIDIEEEDLLSLGVNTSNFDAAFLLHRLEFYGVGKHNYTELMAVNNKAEKICYRFHRECGRFEDWI